MTPILYSSIEIIQRSVNIIQIVRYRKFDYKETRFPIHKNLFWEKKVEMKNFLPHISYEISNKISKSKK